MDTSFQVVDVLDTYKSFIWTDRYCGYGDFEIYTPVDDTLLSVLKEDYYLYINGSDRTMIIESVEIDTDAEEGPFVTISGRSLESILERRVIWGQTILEGSLQDGVAKLLNENVVEPANASRKIDHFAFKMSTDEAVTSLEVSTQYFGENLYEAVTALCNSFQLGFRVLLDISTGVMEFELYSGQDHSYSQMKNPHMIFSPDFENLLSSNYLRSKKAWKNAAMVAGEENDTERVVIDVAEEAYAGLDRREVFVDASGISKTVYESDGSDPVQLTEEEYAAQLTQKGNEKLLQTAVTESFEGEIASVSGYTYGVDFFLGDIVEIANEFGLGAKARATEIIISHDETSNTTIPTFSVVDEGGHIA